MGAGHRSRRRGQGGCLPGRAHPPARPVWLARGLPGRRAREHPHPGAALTLFELHDGWRYTAFITDTATGVVPGGIGGLELRHRLHARVEDRIRQSKAAGLNNFPWLGAVPRTGPGWKPPWLLLTSFAGPS